MILLFNLFLFCRVRSVASFIFLRDKLFNDAENACRVNEDLSWVEANAKGDELIEFGPDDLRHSGLISGKHDKLELEFALCLYHVDPIEGDLDLDLSLL